MAILGFDSCNYASTKTMTDLGYTPPKSDKADMPAAQDSTEESPQYPSLRFNGEQADKAGLSECKYGEEYEITIRVKASRIDGSMSYPGSGDSREKPEVQFDVLACDPPKEVEGDAEDKDDKPDVEEYEKPKSKIELGPPKGMRGMNFKK